jgi:hypothetical protein
MTASAEREKVDHMDGCKGGSWVELHRIDPEASRPRLGTVTISPDGSREFDPKLKLGKQQFGSKKYHDKVIVYYCPSCGVKKEESWTE